MIVVVAGMKRSGSTWMFNVARIALERAGIDFRVGEYDLFRDDPGGSLLIKSHWWHRDLARAAGAVLTSHRPTGEVRDSLTHLWGRPPTGAEMAKVVRHAYRWAAVADYQMPYERLVGDPLGEATRIIDAMGLDADPAAVLAEVKALGLPAEGQDPTTLYFSNHRRPA